MADATLRALERRFRTSGAAEDESAWLVARVRAGELDADRWRLAVFCGHPAAAPLRDGLALCTCGVTRRRGQHTPRCPQHPRTFRETPGFLRLPPALHAWARAFEEHGPQATGAPRSPWPARPWTPPESPPAPGCARPSRSRASTSG